MLTTTCLSKHCTFSITASPITEPFMVTGAFPIIRNQSTALKLMAALLKLMAALFHISPCSSHLKSTPYTINPQCSCPSSVLPVSFLIFPIGHTTWGRMTASILRPLAPSFP